MSGTHSNPARTLHESERSLVGLLQSDATLFGTVVTLADPVLAERLAHGFDFVWIDLEHSALDLRDVQLLTIAVQAGGAFALVRVPRADSECLTAVLDTGVDGVVAPRIAGAREAEGFASSLRYPLAGSRGYAPRRHPPGHRASNSRPWSAVACIVQVETQGALGDLDAIAAADGVHAVVVGANDLSLEMGIGLNLEAAELAEATARVAAAATNHDVAWGLAVSDLPEWVREAPRHGASMIVLASDARLYADGVDSALMGLDALVV